MVHRPHPGRLASRVSFRANLNSSGSEGEAIRIYWNLIDAHDSKDPAWLTDKNHGVGPEFFALTKLVVLWCDAELKINPTAISRYARYVKDRIPYKTPGPGRSIVTRWDRGTKSKTEILAKRALDCWERAKAATESRVPAPANEREDFAGKLSRQQYALLTLLWKTKGQKMSLDTVATKLWGSKVVEESVIRKAIARLNDAFLALDTPLNRVSVTTKTRYAVLELPDK